MRHVYLDHQASTPVSTEVFEAMKPFFTKAFGSPSSLHRHGLHARAQLRRADMEKEERAKAEKGQLLAKGKVLFEHALKTYREKGFRPATPRNRKDARPLKPAALAYTSNAWMPR